MYEKYIDFEEGCKRLMNNKTLYKRLLLSHDQSNVAAALVEAINAGDSDEISCAAHTLKGAALNLSLTMVAQVSSLIEQRAKNGEAAVDLINSLTAATEGTSKAIQSLIDYGQL